MQVAEQSTGDTTAFVHIPAAPEVVYENAYGARLRFKTPQTEPLHVAWVSGDIETLTFSRKAQLCVRLTSEQDSACFANVALNMSAIAMRSLAKQLIDAAHWLDRVNCAGEQE